MTTARQFISDVASASSSSGEPYRVRLADDSVTQTQPWLLAELLRIENGALPAAAAPSAASSEGPAEAHNDASSVKQVLELIRRSGATFLRVESDEVESFTGPRMARHLEMKHALAGSPHLTAEAFITRFCTSSSLHGTVYLVKDGNAQPSRLADWLRERLHPAETRPR